MLYVTHITIKPIVYWSATTIQELMKLPTYGNTTSFDMLPQSTGHIIIGNLFILKSICFVCPLIALEETCTSSHHRFAIPNDLTPSCEIHSSANFELSNRCHILLWRSDLVARNTKVFYAFIAFSLGLSRTIYEFHWKTPLCVPLLCSTPWNFFNSWSRIWGWPFYDRCVK